jgi:hypothetical protein
MSSTPEAIPSQASFAPMPLRVRGVLENLDVAIKAFKQYFWVLVGWAALVNLVNAIPFVNYVSYLFTPPLMIGAACCCVAAAVRGQRVTWRQCWRFTEPRYWSLVAMHVVAGIVLFVMVILIIVVITFGTVYAIMSLSAAFEQLPTYLQVILGIVGALFALIFFSLLMTVLAAWHSMVGIVVCMEEDKRNTRALGRAWELLSGQWKLVISLMMLLGMGILVLWMVLGATGALLMGLPNLRNMMNGTVSENTMWTAAIAFAFGSWLLFSLYMPIHYLALTLLYLDLRVRKEALDLEWTAHTTAPTPAVWEQTPTPSQSFNSAGFDSASSDAASFESSLSFQTTPMPPQSTSEPLSVPQSTLEPTPFASTTAEPSRETSPVVNWHDTLTPQSTLEPSAIAPVEADTSNIASAGDMAPSTLTPVEPAFAAPQTVTSASTSNETTQNNEATQSAAPEEKTANPQAPRW